MSEPQLCLALREPGIEFALVDGAIAADVADVGGG